MYCVSIGGMLIHWQCSIYDKAVGKNLQLAVLLPNLTRSKYKLSNIKVGGNFFSHKIQYVVICESADLGLTPLTEELRCTQGSWVQCDRWGWK